MMTVSLFSQVGFPKKIKYGNDSCIAITYSQMTYINEEHVRSTIYRQISDSLRLVSLRCDTLYKKGQNLILGYEKEIEIQSVIINKEHDLGLIYKDQYELEQKKNRKLRTWLGIGGAGAGATIIGLLIGFLIK